MTGRSTLAVLQHLHRLAREERAGTWNDRECLERFVAQRDEEAFAALVRRHGPMVMGVCRRLLPNRQDAEDTFQATFLVLARKAGSVRWKRSVAPWLYQVAYRLARKGRVEAARRREHERSGNVEAVAPAADPSWREVCAVLDEELHGLTETYRAPLVLCYLEGLTRDEAAERLGWSVGTLKRRLQQGRERLRLRMVRRGVTLPAVLLSASLTAHETTAALPPLIIHELARSAAAFASGSAAGTPCARALPLAETALRTMTVSHAKLAAVLLGVLSLAAGAGLGTCWILAAPTPEQQPAAARSTIPNRGEPRAAKDEQQRTDHYGDPLPPGAVARLGTTRFREGRYLFSLAFSPDGKRMASGSGDRQGIIRIWDTVTGKELSRLGGDSTQVHFLAFSHDGKRLISTESQKRQRHIMVRLWDAVAGKELRQFGGAENVGYPTVLSRDGRRVANAGDGGIRIWDTDSGKQLLRIGEDVGYFAAIAFSNDRNVLAGACGDGSIRLWNAESGKELRRLKGHRPRRGKNNEVKSLAFAPDDRSLASGAADGSVFLWDLTTDKERFGLAATGRQIRGASPDGPNIVAFSPDGARLAVGYTGIVVDAVKGKELVRLEGHYRWLRCLCFSPDGKTLAGENNCRVCFWEAATGKEVFKDTAHHDPVSSLAFFPDGKTLATTSWDRTVHLWETTTGKELLQFRGRGQPYIESNRVAVAPDGRTVAAWLGDTLYRWDVRRPDAAEEFRAPGDGFSRREVAFSAHSRIWAALSEGKQVRVWQDSMDQKPRCLKTLLLEGTRDFGSNGFVFSPNGKIVAAAGADGRVHVWDNATGEIIHVLQGFHRPGSLHNPAVFSIASSPDGTTLALGSSDSYIALWDAAAGKELLQLKVAGRHDFVNALAFAADGKTLAAGYDDGVIRFWETVTAAVRREWPAHPGSIRSLAFSPDSKFLASGSTDTTVLIWDVFRIALGDGQARDSKKDVWDSLWADLAGKDAAKAYRAVGVLASAAKQSVPFLATRLRPIPSSDPRRLVQLIADLDSDQFAVRDKTTRELEEMGELAEAALRRMLAGKPSLEARRRAEELLEKLHGPLPPGERLRSLRAVEVLEHAGTEPARQLLARLAGGAAEARLTREAKGALQRLDRRMEGRVK